MNEEIFFCGLALKDELNAKRFQWNIFFKIAKAGWPTEFLKKFQNNSRTLQEHFHIFQEHMDGQDEVIFSQKWEIQTAGGNRKYCNLKSRSSKILNSWTIPEQAWKSGFFQVHFQYQRKIFQNNSRNSRTVGHPAKFLQVTFVTKQSVDIKRPLSPSWTHSFSSLSSLSVGAWPIILLITDFYGWEKKKYFVGINFGRSIVSKNLFRRKVINPRNLRKPRKFVSSKPFSIKIKI